MNFLVPAPTYLISLLLTWSHTLPVRGSIQQPSGSSSGLRDSLNSQLLFYFSTSGHTHFFLTSAIHILFTCQPSVLYLSSNTTPTFFTPITLSVYSSVQTVIFIPLWLNHILFPENSNIKHCLIWSQNTFPISFGQSQNKSAHRIFFFFLIM